MYCISDQQIDYILADLSARGIETEDLRQNLLDHVCILIEQNPGAEENFEGFYQTTIRSFYKDELCEIEKETRLLMICRNRLVFSRNQFFLLLFAIFIGPFIACNILWLLFSTQSTGWHLPMKIWGATLVYSLFPLLILLVLFLTPERLDPLIPRRSMVLLGIRPFIKIVPFRV